MTRRTRTRILIDILEALSKRPGQPATRLATATNMAYDRLAAILEKLEERGIVEKTRDGNRAGYALTDRGKQLLRELKRLEKILRDFGIETI